MESVWGRAVPNTGFIGIRYGLRGCKCILVDKRRALDTSPLVRCYWPHIAILQEPVVLVSLTFFSLSAERPADTS